MSAVLCCYDIPESLKVKNPSGVFRRYGVRINLSAWVFPAGLVPTEHIAELTEKGVTVHLVEFAEKAQEKVLELARSELRQHAKKVAKYVKERCDKINQEFQRDEILKGTMGETPEQHKEARYRKWRTVLSRARRELIAAEQCALGFGVTRDVEEATDGLKNLLSAELTLALDWKEKHHSKEPAAVFVSPEQLSNGSWLPSVAV